MAFRLKRLTSFAPVAPVVRPRMRSSVMPRSGGSVDCQRPRMTNVMEAAVRSSLLRGPALLTSRSSCQLCAKHQGDRRSRQNPKRLGYGKIVSRVPTVLRLLGFRVVIYPNDHRPGPCSRYRFRL